MFRYPDGTFRQNAPARVELDGYHRKFADLTREERDELGYNEAVPLKREAHTTYETVWEKGEDLLYRETAVSVVVDEAARLSTLAESIRVERNSLLTRCDWTQLGDTPLDEVVRTAWATYRQALREVPQQPGFPGVVDWPAAPAE